VISEIDVYFSCSFNVTHFTDVYNYLSLYGVSMKVLSSLLITTTVATTLFAAKAPTEFFGDGTFGLPPIVDGISLRMEQAEVFELLPHFYNNPRKELDEYDYCEVNLDWSWGTLYNIRTSIKTTDTTTIDYLKQNWGEPITVDNYGTPTYHWLNAEEKLAVSVTLAYGNLNIEYNLYYPAESLIGDTPGFPTNVADLRLGQSEAEIVAKYPEFDDAELENDNQNLDPDGFHKIGYTYQTNDAGNMYVFKMGFSDLESIADVVRRKWGTPQLTESGKEYWTIEGQTGINYSGTEQSTVYVVYKNSDYGNDYLVWTTDPTETY